MSARTSRTRCRKSRNDCMKRGSSRGPASGSTGHRGLMLAGSVLVLLLVMGWTWSILHARTITQAGEVVSQTPAAAVANALTHTNAPTAAYLTDAALTAWTSHLLDAQRGASGKLRVAFEPPSRGISPESLPKGGTVRYGTDTIT